jgi:hypothetical protein
MTRKHRPTAADQARTKQVDAIVAFAELAGIVLLDWQKRYIEASVPLEQPETVAVRHLGVEHLGRWAELPSLPDDAPRTHAGEPTRETTPAGRLVGIRMTENDKKPRGSGGSTVPTRTLVIQQGAQMVALVYPTDHPVIVAPRNWS